MYATLIFPFLLLYLFFCFIVAFLGQKREIGFWSSFLVSTLLSPLIGLFIIIASKENTPNLYKIKNSQLTKQQAISKLKESKDLLDLEMMTQEEFNSLKHDLTPIITRH